jgi:hypothetical protein
VLWRLRHNTAQARLAAEREPANGRAIHRRMGARLALPISYFVDWDRAKSARHDLVDSYVSSGWPPADLLVTAIKAGIETYVLKRLVRHYRGRKYLERALRDSDRLEPSLRSKIWNFASDPQGSGKED